MASLQDFDLSRSTSPETQDDDTMATSSEGEDVSSEDVSCEDVSREEIGSDVMPNTIPCGPGGLPLMPPNTPAGM